MHSWLSERRRAAVSTLMAACTAAVLVLVRVRDNTSALLSGADVGVLALSADLFTYLAVTLTAFSTASPARIRGWAHEAHGTLIQRYVLGTAPGPGVYLFIAAAALVVASTSRRWTFPAGRGRPGPTTCTSRSPS